MDGIVQSPLGPILLKRFKDVDSYCRLSNCVMTDAIFEYGLLEINKLRDAKEMSLEYCNSMCEIMNKSFLKRSDTLLIFTTCNHIDMTTHSLNSLRYAPDSFDIIVIDDYSVDGTVEYLVKRVSIMGYMCFRNLYCRVMLWLRKINHMDLPILGTLVTGGNELYL